MTQVVSQRYKFPSSTRLSGRAPSTGMRRSSLTGGLALPAVELVDRHANGSVTVRVSVFSETEPASHDEAAAINGVAAEFRFEDA